MRFIVRKLIQFWMENFDIKSNSNYSYQINVVVGKNTNRVSKNIMNFRSIAKKIHNIQIKQSKSN